MSPMIHSTNSSIMNRAISQLLLSLVAFSALVYIVNAEKPCERLSNPGSSLWTSLEKEIGKNNVNLAQNQAMSYVKNEASDLCFGSIPVDKVIEDLIPIINSDVCQQANDYFQYSNDIKTIKEKVDQVTRNPASIFSFFDWLKKADDFYGRLCDKSNAALIPCVSSLIPTIVELLKSHTSGCCAGFFSEVENNFGMDFLSLINRSLTSANNLVCAIRSPGNDGKPSQRCGQAFAISFFGSFTDAFGMLNTFRIPNNQGCLAFTGQTFQFVDGKYGKLINSKNNVDCCSMYWDSLVSLVGGFPIVQKTNINGVQLSSLFNNGQCMSGKIFPAIPVVGGIAQKQCLHLANSFSHSCSFSAQCQGYGGPTNNPVPPKNVPKPTSPKPTPGSKPTSPKPTPGSKPTSPKPTPGSKPTSPKPTPGSKPTSPKPTPGSKPTPKDGTNKPTPVSTPPPSYEDAQEEGKKQEDSKKGKASMGIRVTRSSILLSLSLVVSMYLIYLM